jgi:hypothetical protein
MLRVLTTEEAAEHRERDFRFVEPGFIVDMGNIRPPNEARYALVKSKNEADQTLQVVPLTQKNVFSLLDGVIPPAVTISKNELLNVHATAVTDAMCREREGFSTFCIDCKERAYALWGRPNYVVGADGMCHHYDCTDTHRTRQE